MRDVLVGLPRGELAHLCLAHRPSMRLLAGRVVIRGIEDHRPFGPYNCCVMSLAVACVPSSCAERRLASPGVCHRWLPSRLPGVGRPGPVELQRCIREGSVTTGAMRLLPRCLPVPGTLSTDAAGFRAAGIPPAAMARESPRRDQDRPHPDTEPAGPDIPKTAGSLTREPA
jgi:hypothetical protein